MWVVQDVRCVTSGAFPPDGIEEVFAAVGESVSFSCSNTSSLGVGGSVRWDVAGRTLSDDMSPYKGQIGAFGVSKGSSSLIISKVSALHAGDYQCSGSTGQQMVFNKIRLHTVDGECENFKVPKQSMNCAALTFSVCCYSSNFLSCLPTQLLQSVGREEIISP